MNAAATSQAVLLWNRAEKTLNKQAGWFTSQNTILEQAGDEFQQAANQFKLEKRFKEAGDAFSKEAECREKMKEPNEAANAWWNAAKAYKQTHPDLAVGALTHTVTLLTATGKWRQAADREKDIAAIYLNELNDLRKAYQSYAQAGEWYAQEDSQATANSCYKEAADLAAELGEYRTAVQHYERVADASLSSALSKYSVKEYWLRAGLCTIATGDYVIARRQLQSYQSKDVTFGSTREAKFLSAIIDACENDDEQEFTNAVVDFDHVMKLDNWKTKILLDIKNKMVKDDGIGGFR